MFWIFWRGIAGNDLIETFCIVNTQWLFLFIASCVYLIETFCIVNLKEANAAVIRINI